MSDAETNKKQASSSCPKHVLQPVKDMFVKFNQSLQNVVVISQQSRSGEACRSLSSTAHTGDECLMGHPLQEATDTNDPANTSVRTWSAESRARRDKDTDSGHWLCCEESMPVSMLHPDHQSSSGRDCQYLSIPDYPTSPGKNCEAWRDCQYGSPGREDAGCVAAAGCHSGSSPSHHTHTWQPGDMRTPITGFHTMESRCKFTVYKIQVQKPASESSWFVFRRYSDFLHLSERLKYLFPELHLPPIPPKRWFRNNFDLYFLEERMLGLQRFLDSIAGDRDICNSAPVQGFFCTDEPPGPHDTLEESRALCETLEERMHGLKCNLQEKEEEIEFVREEIKRHKSQMKLLSSQLKVTSGREQPGHGKFPPLLTNTDAAECD